MQKGLRLTDLAEKERILHDKEYQNKQLREKLEELKKRFNNHSDLLEEETKNSIYDASIKYKNIEEQRRLDKKRDEKFQ